MPFTLFAQSLSGELKAWHKVTLTFDGPQAAETGATNPFLDYRLDVTFTNGTETYRVPGYFAADGNAAETSATAGTKWRVHLAPSQAGTWTWTASFRTGPEVAVSQDPNAGTPTSFDGLTGSFNIQPTDKTGRDHRAKGRLQYVGKHHLQFAETGEYFLKIGADAPENFLAYQDFDNTPDYGGRRKDWAPHLQDWQAGHPTWQGGKGKGIIGAINYLAAEGQNVFSFLTMNINGDDKNVFPYLSDQAADRTRMDCSKLDQWEIVLEHGDHMGMYLHFKTQETENDQLLDGGALGVERKLYYRELIARFSHHLALNWNVGEENTNTEQQRKDFAQYISELDPYDHHIVLHTYPNQQAVYDALMGTASAYTGASIQTGWNNVHRVTKDRVHASALAGKPWVVANDEVGGANTGVPHDDYTGTPTQKDIRHKVLWGNILAGGAGVEYYFGYQLPHSDLTCQDFRSRDRVWDFNRYAHQFFVENALPFWQMSNEDQRLTANEAYCLAKEKELYVLYLPNGTTEITLDNPSQGYRLRWFDPRNGGNLQDGTITQLAGTGQQSVGVAPNNGQEDWVVLLEALPINGNYPPSVTWQAPLDGSFVEENQAFELAVEAHDPDGSVQSVVFYEGNTPLATLTEAPYTFQVAGRPAGSYTYHAVVTDGEGLEASTPPITLWVGTGQALVARLYDATTNQPITAHDPLTDGMTINLATVGTSLTIVAQPVGISPGSVRFGWNGQANYRTESVAPYALEGDTGGDFNPWTPALGTHALVMTAFSGESGSGDLIGTAQLQLTFIDDPDGGTPPPPPPPPSGGGPCEAPFEEQDGIVIIEAESAPIAGDWQLSTDIPGYTGEGYYVWTGPNHFSDPGNGLLTYTFQIHQTGTYRFRWHSYITMGNSNSEHNDSWLRFPDASDFYGEKNGSRVYPRGTGQTPNPNGASKDGWLKVYFNRNGQWSWDARTSDHDAHNIFVEFDEPGVYTMEISGRSTGHGIDRIALHHSTASGAAATDLTRAESLCIPAEVAGGLNIRLLLEGFWQGAGNPMRTQLSAGHLLPLDQPFTLAPWMYDGTERLSERPAEMVDWVLLELRDTANTRQVVARKAACLYADGWLRDVAGHDSIRFEGVPPGSYYLLVQQQSHLAVMTRTPLALDRAQVYDFSTAGTQAIGNEQLKPRDGVFLLYAGDYDHNGVINNQDFNRWKQDAASIDAYLPIDGDGNGIINNLDYNLWTGNRSKIGAEEWRP